MRALELVARSVLVFGLLLSAGREAMAERMALVIGNNDYVSVAKLQKAVGDARAMKEILERLNFTVTLAENVDRDQFGDALDAFATKVSEGDEVVVFYAGHGVAIGGRNLLLPTDIAEPQPGQERRIERSSYDAAETVEAIRAKKPKYVFAVLDACRNNPFEGPGRSIGLTRGLARMEAEPGAFILFSAGPGEAALDRLGNNDAEPTSVFTRVLLKHIGTPGLTLQGIAKATQRHVRSLALTIDHRQFPDYSDRMEDEPVLVPGDPASAAAPQLGTERAQADTAYRLALLDGSTAALEKVMRDYPNHSRLGEVLDRLEARDDDAAFVKAKEADRIEAYEAYRRERPRGLHIAAADKAISALTSPPPLEALRMHYERATNEADMIIAVAISPDGRTLAAGGDEGSVKLWDLGEGRPLRTLDNKKSGVGRVVSVAFSPDGQILAVGTSRKEVRLWEAGTGRLLRVLVA